MTDGINNHGAFLSTYAVPPILDTIQEFKVNSHNDQAEFGSSLGGIINVVTKSGTNAVHGTAFYFVRNDVFDARNTFLPDVTPFRQNQFGYSSRGSSPHPEGVRRPEQDFFYGALQEFYYRSPAHNFYRVPTAANYSGDLSDIPTQIFQSVFDTGGPEEPRPVHPRSVPRQPDSGQPD